MQLMIGKGAIVTGAASETNRFLQYPVMSTLRPAYPRGPWHYKNMHQLVVTYESTAEAVRAVLPPPLQPADGNRVTIEWRHMAEVSGFGPVHRGRPFGGLHLRRQAGHLRLPGISR